MSDHPRPPKGPTRRDPREQCTFIFSILVAAMTGIAFQEMVVGVGGDFRRACWTSRRCCLPVCSASPRSAFSSVLRCT